MSVLEDQGIIVTNLALLHAGGWDEILMIAVGLAAAWAIIAWTGRSRSYEDDEDDEDHNAEAAAGDESSRGREDGPPGKLKGNRNDE